MVILAFLSDPEVVRKILRHLGLPSSPPALAPARSSGRTMGFALPEEEGAWDGDPREETDDCATSKPRIRPPP